MIGLKVTFASPKAGFRHVFALGANLKDTRFVLSGAQSLRIGYDDEPQATQLRSVQLSSRSLNVLLNEDAPYLDIDVRVATTQPLLFGRVVVPDGVVTTLSNGRSEIVLYGTTCWALPTDYWASPAMGSLSADIAPQTSAGADEGRPD